MSDAAPHVPVLIEPLIAAVAPVSGTWIDGTFGAGGYTRRLLDAGAGRVIGIDRDPMVAELTASWRDDRIELVTTTFSQLDTVTDHADGVVLDLGVSSMQIDTAERGFSFQKDGPLDMRMGADGPSAADLVRDLGEAALADVLYQYGEERASRRIAKAIVKARDLDPITRTLVLADIVAGCLPRPKPGQSHPATRSFQALRIAVNAEYDQISQGLNAAERLLKPGGYLAVVTFHSVEDRIVKRFFQSRADTKPGSRHAPATVEMRGTFDPVTRKAIKSTPDEIAANPRARSAVLRIGVRTDAPVGDQSNKRLGIPQLKPQGRTS